ncbi:hypothetical protein XENTR_v10010562 [Xenopus tropicalis]|uniref:F-box/WD repeat-containing protein 7-like n=1 Tax=Xenopus tropicalis TaxID=8364 RepID=A0A803K5Q7_XENTR|nr:F-box/WD repeat-containing protein 7-like [Xenopus tropicalis]KAE8606007.1 hypothetical protein XENTR_v10010562 [Xenopus tropicalis]
MGCARQSRMEAGEPQDCTSWLPDELALRILSYLDAKDILQVAQTCQRWRELAEDEGLWQGKCKADGIEEPHTATGSRPRPWKSAYMSEFRMSIRWPRVRCKCVTLDISKMDLNFTHWTFDGNKMVCIASGNAIKIWSTVTGKPIRALVGHTDEILTLRMRDHMIVSGSKDQTVKVWNAESGECIHTLGGHTGAVRCVNLHEKWAASGSCDGTIRIWDTETGRCLYNLSLQLQDIEYIRYDGQRLTSLNNGDVKIWDPETQSRLFFLPLPDGNIRHLKLKGTNLYVVSETGAATMWDLGTGRCLDLEDLQYYMNRIVLEAGMFFSGCTDLHAALRSKKYVKNFEMLRFKRAFWLYGVRLCRNMGINGTGFGPAWDFQQVPIWNFDWNSIGLNRIFSYSYRLCVSDTKLICLIEEPGVGLTGLTLDFPC